MFNEENIDKIKTYLLAKKENIAVAESVTAGLLQAALSSARDAIHFFEGGLTAYNIGQKSRLLKMISPVHALQCNCVSSKMANDMAASICQLYTTDWGIGITGYATPVPESGNKVFAFYNITYKQQVKEEGKLEGKNDNALDNQLHYVNQVLEKLSACLSCL